MRDTVGSEAQPLTSTVAVVSTGIVGGVLLPELDDEEDVKAETDMNVVSITPGWRAISVPGRRWAVGGRHQVPGGRGQVRAADARQLRVASCR